VSAAYVGGHEVNPVEVKSLAWLLEADKRS
jgi:hypothetical protein